MLDNHIALSAILRGVKTEKKSIDTRLRVFAKRRWSSQPARPSAGAFSRTQGHSRRPTDARNSD